MQALPIHARYLQPLRRGAARHISLPVRRTQSDICPISPLAPRHSEPQHHPPSPQDPVRFQAVPAAPSDSPAVLVEKSRSAESREISCLLIAETQEAQRASVALNYPEDLKAASTRAVCPTKRSQDAQLKLGGRAQKGEKQNGARLCPPYQICRSKPAAATCTQP